MFTGLVFEVGRVALPPEPLLGGGRRLVLAHSEELSRRLAPGASLAVSGVCLTVTRCEPGQSTVELSPETLRRTRFRSLERGAKVNLEPCLRLQDGLGGHWMTGHVDGLVRVLERRTQGAFVELKLDLPQELERWVAPKGSVALDGVSLTVAWLEPAAFGVALIPETLARTTLGQVREGDELHFEADLLARYVVRALEVWTQRP